MVMNIPPEEVQQEESHLANTLKAIDSEVANICDRLPAEAAHRDTAELIQQKGLAELDALDRMRPNPYFGRIILTHPERTDPVSVYLGLHHFGSVSNWEAPIARLYYRPGDGRYFVDGRQINAKVTLKRALTIEETKLTSISDALRLAAPPGLEALPAGEDSALAEEFTIGDDRALSRSLEATGLRELHEIVATIQPDQYSLIAETNCKVMIVQGAAGSGKSLIGLHRLAFLLSPFNDMSERDRPKANRVLMIGPSAAFLNYVRNLLPSLVAQPIAQSTLRDWMLQQFSQPIRLGQNNRLFRDLMSNQAKLGESEWAAERFKGSMEMKEIIDRHVWQRRELHRSFTDEYLRMVESNATLRAKGVTADKPFTDTDLAPLLYMDHLLNRHKLSEYEHIVIDEAQDISPLEVDLLRTHSRNGWFTILGDLRQKLTPYRGVANWQELRWIFPKGDSQRFDARNCYRSTAQITKFGNRILRRLPEQADSPIPHAREGDPPKLHRSATVREMYATIAAGAQEALAAGQTVAVFTRTSQDAQAAYRHMEAAGIEQARLLRTNDIITTNLTVCPILLSKGLEFDMVLVAGVDAESFTGSDMDNRLLYLACSRARHRLAIHWVGRPSSLILDLGAVGMEVGGQLDTSRGKRSVFDRFRSIHSFRRGPQ